jgi:hypothetical protein
VEKVSLSPILLFVSINHLYPLLAVTSKPTLLFPHPLVSVISKTIINININININIGEIESEAEAAFFVFLMITKLSHVASS